MVGQNPELRQYVQIKRHLDRHVNLQSSGFWSIMLAWSIVDN